MKITGPINTATSPSPGTRTSAPRTARPEATAEASESVRISAASTALVDSEPGIDQARISEIRQAIAEGRFKINPGAIADRLITTARELVDSQRRG